ncbi:MAG TPA: OsmC family protein [Candidatus Limnocylindrales bacterium]|nr:OsmC family protein [Candidatus Limnocylindrales bacterium]
MADGMIERVNGVDVGELREYIEAVAADVTRADRNPVVVATWVGGTRAQVMSALGGPPVYMGGDDDPSAMGMLLRTLAACDVEVIANRAALLGVQIEDLSVEARGYFNIKRYLGLEAKHGPGYQDVSYTIRLKTKGASPEQLEEIRRACVEGSPVGETLERPVSVSMEFEAA